MYVCSFIFQLETREVLSMDDADYPSSYDHLPLLSVLHGWFISLLLHHFHCVRFVKQSRKRQAVRPNECTVYSPGCGRSSDKHHPRCSESSSDHSPSCTSWDIDSWVVRFTPQEQQVSHLRSRTHSLFLHSFLWIGWFTKNDVSVHRHSWYICSFLYLEWLFRSGGR